MERGRPRTRRIIARVILPRCGACLPLFSSSYPLLVSSVSLARTGFPGRVYAS